MKKSMNINKLKNLESEIIIAVDGDAASGKGTLCSILAKKFNLEHCQTSIFYRKLAKYLLEEKITDLNLILEKAKDPNIFNNITMDGIYNESVTNKSSEIAVINDVREALNIPQKEILKNNRRVIMEGRDIGTVIAPNADVKLYVTADLDKRAERRFLQYSNNGKDVTLNQIKQQLEDRDKRDKSRANAPLKIADNALFLDSSNMDINEFTNHSIEKISEFLESI